MSTSLSRSAPEPTQTPDPDESLLASAVRFLVEGGEFEVASVLLSCTLRTSVFDSWNEGDSITAEIIGPRSAYDEIRDDTSTTRGRIEAALDAVLDSNRSVARVIARAKLEPAQPGWREDVNAIMRGGAITNQAVGSGKAQDKPLRIWNGLGFRSASEIRIADALEAVGVFFLPNCRGRLGAAKQRVNREADFLVCYRGKWGILEVDGDLFHPATRTVEDHARDRLFKEQGVRLVEHFDAKECFETAPRIVERFLALLEKS